MADVITAVAHNQIENMFASTKAEDLAIECLRVTLDGAVARLTNTRTELGAHLDPLADKLLVISAFIALGLLHEIPLRLMIMVIVRDTVILGGYLVSAVVVGKAMAMAPSMWGKVTTFLQIVSIGVVMLALAGWWTVPDGLREGVFIATGIATLVSGAGYVVDGIRFYQASESSDGQA